MKRNPTLDCAELRQRAQKKLQNRQGTEAPTSLHEMQRLLEELQIHQIELEMQNEELQRAHAELEASQERYFDLYDLAPICYVTVSQADEILEANLTTANMLGVARSVLAGLPLWRFILRDDINLYRLHLEQLFTKGENQICELRVMKSDESPCWVHMVMSLAPQSSDPECRIVFHDISERKRAEELLEQRTSELLEVQRQYLHAEKLAAVGRLSASIAHEFNNPLQSVTSVLQGTVKFANLQQDNLNLLGLALQECKRMANLIVNLQNFYRPTSGNIESINLHDIFDSLLLIARKDLVTKKITVVKEYSANLPNIKGVKDQLMQVFLNLLNNAVDACEGSCVITVSTEVIDAEKVAFRIRDNGAGIDPAHLDKIFEPFFTTKQRNKGTGLGLSVCHGIVSDHGGHIDVASERGKGTVFSVFLPIPGMKNRIAK